MTDKECALARSEWVAILVIVQPNTVVAQGAQETLTATIES